MTYDVIYRNMWSSPICQLPRTYEINVMWQGMPGNGILHKACNSVLNPLCPFAVRLVSTVKHNFTDPGTSGFSPPHQITDFCEHRNGNSLHGVTSINVPEIRGSRGCETSNNNQHYVKKRHKCAHIFMWSTHYSCQISIKFELFRRVLEKSSNIKFHENPSSRSRVVPSGRMDGQTWKKARFPQFYGSP